MIKINGVTVWLTDDLYIGLYYDVPEGSSRYNRNHETSFQRLTDSEAKNHYNTDSKCNIMLCGGFNSRTATIAYSVPYDAVIDELGLPVDYIPDSLINRYSQDNGTNSIDMCRQTGLWILNDRVGNYLTIGTCICVGSRALV